MESLTKFLKSQRKLDNSELQKLWRGLFYTMWFSDRPRTQQRLADDLANLLLVIDSKTFIGFLSAFWTIIARDWDGIDKHRIDKFYLLIRRYVAAALRRLQNEGWEDDWIEAYNQVMREIPLNVPDAKIPNALRLHMFDIYLDEMEKVFKESLDDEEDTIDGEKFPISKLLEPVEKIAKDSRQKLIRQNATMYILQDERLKQWGVAAADSDSDDDDDDESEWKGFD